MTRRTMQLGASAVRIADDDPLAGDLQQWAVVRARVVDELTGQPPRVPLSLVSALPCAQLRVADGGLCGLVARPRDVAGALQTPGTIVVLVQAPGYLPRDLTPQIDAVRRQLVLLAPAGATSMTVTPADPLPAAPAQRLQFRPGRGLLTARAVAAGADDFTLVSSAAPAGANDVPRQAPLDAARWAGSAVAGVPLALGDTALHRARAIAIRGRIQRTLPGPPPALVPAVGAGFGVIGYWADYPSTRSAPAQPLDFVALDPPLYLAQDVGAPIEGITPAPIGAALSVRAQAAAGSTELLLSPHGALNPAGGELLQLGDPLQADVEIVTTAGFTPPVDAAGPARVRLHTPTARLHRASTPAQRCLPTLPQPAGAVLREAQPGDAVVFGGNVAALPTAGWLIVAPGTARGSVHRYRQIPRATPTGLAAPNDYAFSHAAPIDAASGAFEWPALGRVAQLAVIAVAGAQRLQFNFALDYEGDNPMSLVLP